jgi:type III secretion protein L
MSFLLARQAAMARSAEAAVTPMCKIVRADEYAVLVPAQALLAQAQRDAAATMARSGDEARAARARGYEEGRALALQEQACEMLRLEQARRRYIASVESQMVELVMSAVRKIVSEFDDDARIGAAVRGALAIVRAQQRVLLKAHPEDAAGLRARAQTLLAGFPGIDYLDVAADDHIARGTCRLETDAGAVVAGIEGQLQALQTAFGQALSAHGAEDPHERLAVESRAAAPE